MKRLIPFVASVALAFVAEAVTHVDVLVAYDTSAQQWLEGEGLVTQDFAESQIALANLVLENSGLANSFDFRLAGVHSGTFLYDKDFGLKNTLDAAIEASAPAWVALRNDRDKYGADIVAILADTGVTSGEMGLAWGMAPAVQMNGSGEYVRQWGLDFSLVKEWLAWFAERAFCIVDVAAADRSGVFVHEIGHVMGAGHADISTLQESGPQLYPYSSGMMVQGIDGNHYATIMGYVSDQTSSSPNYEILPYFSSPDVVNPITGEPLGDATHNNAQTLRNTYGVVSKFRAEVGGTDGGEDIVAPIAVQVQEIFTARKTTFKCALRDGGNVVGVAQIVVAATKKGVSKVTGYVIGLDGKKKSLKGTKCEVFGDGNGVAYVTLDGVVVKGYQSPLHVTLGSDGSVLDGSLGDIDITSATIGMDAQSAGFYIDEPLDFVLGNEVLQSIEYGDAEYPLLPYEDCAERVTTGAKWKVAAKAGKIKMVKDRAAGTSYLVPVLGAGNANTNLSGLKLSYQAKTGVFKGSFTAYALVNARLKKYKFNVTGVVADSVGTGIAIFKKAGLSLKVIVE